MTSHSTHRASGPWCLPLPLLGGGSSRLSLLLLEPSLLLDLSSYLPLCFTHGQFFFVQCFGLLARDDELGGRNMGGV